MKLSYVLMYAVLILAANASFGAAQTWICDAQASVGFDRQRGYDAITFRAARSYRIQSGISPEDLTLEDQRGDRVFRHPQDGSLRAASIQSVGENFVSLCIHRSSTTPPFPYNTIICEGPLSYGNRFVFNLRTGLFSLVAVGFESDLGTTTWIEVGSCRRIM